MPRAFDAHYAAEGQLGRDDVRMLGAIDAAATEFVESERGPVIGETVGKLIGHEAASKVLLPDGSVSRRRLRRSLASLALGLCLCASAFAASAPPPSHEALTQARAHFRQGEAYQSAGAYDQALAEYEAAFKLAPLPALLFNMGQANRLRGNKAAALDAYQRYLGATPDGPGADEARSHVAELTVAIREDQERAVRADQDREAAAQAERTRLEHERLEHARVEQERLERERAAAPAVVLSAAPPPPKKPVYKRWWFWTAIGGGVAVVLGVGLGVGLSPVRYPTTVGTVRGN